MAGRGRAPKPDRINHHELTRGAPTTASTVGWAHGEPPAPPDGLMPASINAWATWFEAWFAAFWTPADLPGLRHMIRLYDQVERSEWSRATELRLTMDTYGVTPKGQQDRRWRPPADPTPHQPTTSHYARLRVVGESTAPVSSLPDNTP